MFKKSDHEKMGDCLMKLAEKAAKKRMHILSSTLIDISAELYQADKPLHKTDG